MTQPDPMTAMAMGAAATHELYSAYVAAGFTEEQALVIVVEMMKHAAGRMNLED